ncbi:TPA: prophage tail fiber N-terminal domain-containing protein [Aeromonas hydrophila]
MIQIDGVITDPAGKPVPRALIELRALSTTGEVLMGSAMTFKCDQAGEYRFQLAAGTYDVYAQNDLCGDMDYMGTGVVTAQSTDGPLNSILVDSGINLTPPLLERAVEAMNRSESAARATEQDKQQTGSDVIATEQASNSAAKHAKAAAASALVAGNAEKGVTEKAADVDQNARLVADHAARVEVQSAGVTKSAATIAQQSLAVAAIEKAVTEMRDVVVTKTTAAQSAATNAGGHASNAEKAALATESAKVVTLEKAGRVDIQAQQVSADSNLVQEKATQVAENAATVAGQAKEVSSNTDTVSQAKTAIQGMRDVVVAKTTQAQAAADTASTKASQAAQDQASANGSSQRASVSEGMAEAWAQNPEGSDINGRPGEFSALHWALQAQKWAQAITSQLVWAGPWNAAAGAPVVPAVNQGVPFYRVSHPGMIASVSYVAGDYLHWDPATRSWFKIDGSDAVISVNGMTGAVVLSAADVGARPASWVPGWADITNKPVTMPPSEHSHPWSQLSNVPVYASRWPTLAEVGAAAVSHTHPWAQLTGIPVYATRWPAWGEVTDKPDLALATHRHSWSQLDQIPVTASRWPTWSEITGKPSIAAAAHRHPWSELDEVPATASRWPSYDEVADKPDVALAVHRHPWSQLDQVPVQATRWPAWGEVTGKPTTMPPSAHSHSWAELSGVPIQATRWPSWAEVTDKPALAAAEHTHPYMANGGSYGTLYLNNWFRSTGATGWYNETYGGGIYMEDATWVRTYNGKKFHVSNTEGDCVSLAGGIYAAGNANVNDVYIRSDYRLKSNFEPISNALCKVRQLSGMIYDKAGGREAGLIAQDVAKVQPESVYLNEDGYLSLASAGILALVVEALKELDEKVEALDDRSQ